MELIRANTRGNARRATLNGRPHVVVPMTMLVPGVLAGSNGPLYYPPAELARTVDSWNGMDVVAPSHPTDASGQNVSARSPGVLDKYGIGRVYNARIRGKDGALVGDAWLDEQSTREKFPQLLDAVLAGKKTELSTGLYTVNKPVLNGRCPRTGREYALEATKHRPDHLAILLHEKGACDIEAGCGLGVNAARKTTANCGGPGSGVPGPCPTKADPDDAHGWDPTPYYHGTDRPGLDLTHKPGQVISFTDDQGHAREFGKDVHEVRLRIKNPLDLTHLGAGAGEEGEHTDERVTGRRVKEALAEHGIHVPVDVKAKGWTTDLLRKHLPEIVRQGSEKGFDAIKVKDYKEWEADETMVFHPSQVRVHKPTGNCGGPGSGVPGPCPSNPEPRPMGSDHLSTTTYDHSVRQHVSRKLAGGLKITESEEVDFLGAGMPLTKNRLPTVLQNKLGITGDRAFEIIGKMTPAGTLKRAGKKIATYNPVELARHAGVLHTNSGACCDSCEAGKQCEGDHDEKEKPTGNWCNQHGGTTCTGGAKTPAGVKPQGKGVKRAALQAERDRHLAHAHDVLSGKLPATDEHLGKLAHGLSRLTAPQVKGLREKFAQAKAGKGVKAEHVEAVKQLALRRKTKPAAPGVDPKKTDVKHVPGVGTFYQDKPVAPARPKKGFLHKVGRAIGKVAGVLDVVGNSDVVFDAALAALLDLGASGDRRTLRRLARYVANCGGEGSGKPGPCPSSGGHDAAHEVAGKLVSTLGPGRVPLNEGHYVAHTSIVDAAKYGASEAIDTKHLISKINEHLASRGLMLEKKTGVSVTKSSRGGGQTGKASGYTVVHRPTGNVAPPDADALAAVSKELAGKGAMPGYGQVFRNGGHVWYVGGDGDEWDEPGLPDRLFARVPGVTRLTYEAETFPPAGGGWERVHPPAPAKADGQTANAGPDAQLLAANLWSEAARAAAAVARRLRRRGKLALRKAGRTVYGRTIGSIVDDVKDAAREVRESRLVGVVRRDLVAVKKKAKLAKRFAEHKLRQVERGAESDASRRKGGVTPARVVGRPGPTLPVAKRASAKPPAPAGKTAVSADDVRTVDDLKRFMAAGGKVSVQGKPARPKPAPSAARRKASKGIARFSHNADGTLVLHANPAGCNQHTGPGCSGGGGGALDVALGLRLAARQATGRAFDASHAAMAHGTPHTLLRATEAARKLARRAQQGVGGAGGTPRHHSDASRAHRKAAEAHDAYREAKAATPEAKAAHLRAATAHREAAASHAAVAGHLEKEGPMTGTHRWDERVPVHNLAVDGRVVNCGGEGREARPLPVRQGVPGGRGGGPARGGRRVVGLTGNNFPGGTTVKRLNRAKVIAALTGNCDCWKGAEKTLEALSDDQLRAVKGGADVEAAALVAYNAATGETQVTCKDLVAFVANAGKKASDEDSQLEEPEDRSPGKKIAGNSAKPFEGMTDEQAFDALPPSLQKIVRNAKKVEDARKTELVGKLTANCAKDKLEAAKSRFTAMDLDTLEDLAAALPVGNARPVDDDNPFRTAPVGNAGEEDDEDGLFLNAAKPANRITRFGPAADDRTGTVVNAGKGVVTADDGFDVAGLDEVIAANSVFDRDRALANGKPGRK